jgi:hypothetical protein
MNGLEPVAVHELAELMMGRRVERRVAESPPKAKGEPAPKARRRRKRQASSVPAG